MTSHYPDTDLPLDEDWIHTFEKTDESYSLFYKEDNEILKVKYIYVGLEGHVQRVKRERIILTQPNIITNKELIEMIRFNQPKTYALKFAMKYNVNVDPCNVKHLFSRRINEETFITDITDFTQHVCFDKTIPMFQELNELSIYFVMRKHIGKTTKKHFSRQRHNTTKTFRIK